MTGEQIPLPDLSSIDSLVLATSSPRKALMFRTFHGVLTGILQPTPDSELFSSWMRNGLSNGNGALKGIVNLGEMFGTRVIVHPTHGETDDHDPVAQARNKVLDETIQASYEGQNAVIVGLDSVEQVGGTVYGKPVNSLPEGMHIEDYLISLKSRILVPGTRVINTTAIHAVHAQRPSIAAEGQVSIRLRISDSVGHITLDPEAAGGGVSQQLLPKPKELSIRQNLDPRLYHFLLICAIQGMPVIPMLQVANSAVDTTPRKHETVLYDSENTC